MSKKTPAASENRAAPQPLRFSTVNAALGLAGLVTVAVGYYMLAQGSITVAPLLLVLGYVVFFPLAIIL